MSDGPNILVTCHANADFDAFAAMLAARRLYGRCGLLFPGSQERPLQKVYAEIDKKAYGFVDGTPDWKNFDCLVLVDTRQRSRVRHVFPLLERRDTRVEIWDHHPNSAEDIVADETYIAEVGAVTSLLAHRMRERNVTLSQEEATLLGLGIYSDTGSFTYSSTIADDFLAAVWLLSQGMDVRQINEMASHELTSQHIHALNMLLKSAHTYTIGDHPVVLADVSLEHYLGDFAALANKLVEMKKFPVLFAIGRMGNRVQVVARSHNKAIDVGKICVSLGGGGHSYAASAAIRDATIVEVRETILRRIHAQRNPDIKTVREYMTAPAIGIDEDACLVEANGLMQHFGLKAAPVFRHNTHACAGLLNAQTASRAVAHGLGGEPVREYMQRCLRMLPSDAVLQELCDIIVGNSQRLVPIVERDEIVGVVTRTDLINVFANDADLISVRKSKKNDRNIGKYLRNRLPAEIREILELVGETGERLTFPVYAVGGFVRDMVLGKQTQDIDLVVEGNGIALARELARQLNGRVREHQKFMTSVVIFHNSRGKETRIDVATARLEYYESPAALPTVEFSSLNMDLFRRDFSINALAVRLDGEHCGVLADFFGGWQDIRDRTIRVLHTLSFVEDPTRCLRAVRFEQRYAFRIGQGTEKLIKNALSLKLIDRLSTARIFNEYRHICDEVDPPACFARLHETGILHAINPSLALTLTKSAVLQKLKETLAWYDLLYFHETANPWLVYFYGFTTGLHYKDVCVTYDRLGLPESKKRGILHNYEQLRPLKDGLLKWQKKDYSGSTKVSVLCDMLRNVSRECLIYLIATADNEGVRKMLSHYITQWSREQPDITGDDLCRLGLAPGPALASVLRAVLTAKLDGTVVSVGSQFRLAKKLVEQFQNEEAPGDAK
ncbi:MAG: DHH family phosphoesterase [Desulfovibrio sp.]|jgi:tRNA nucleotidyltransferase (CCA-adding enzyme)|nr:DHH family phosphoesterase [Desulfovibrio sp.]